VTDWVVAATLGAYRMAQKRSEGDVKAWSKTGQAKVALKCQTLEEMHRLAQLAEEAGVVNYTVVDAGRTQIAEGSETVLAIGPAPKEVIDKITGHLKLL
jgi:peptidyl-tRNA hydrolase